MLKLCFIVAQCSIILFLRNSINSLADDQLISWNKSIICRIRNLKISYSKIVLLKRSQTSTYHLLSSTAPENMSVSSLKTKKAKATNNLTNISLTCCPYHNPSISILELYYACFPCFLLVNKLKIK